MSKSVVVFGSFNVDLMARANHLPVPGETVIGSSFQQSAGGKGFNQAVAAHKAGANVKTVIKVGCDTLSHVALDLMDKLGMSRDYVLTNPDLPTGTALITVSEKTAQNAIVITPAANGSFTSEDIAKIAPILDEAEYLLLQLEVNQAANEELATLAKQHHVKVIVNTAPYQPLCDEFLNGTYLVTPNEVEAEEMTGIAIDSLSSADRAAAWFRDKGVDNVVITLGSKGVYLSADGKSEIIPANRVTAVDTTGAGDGFNGGLLTALAEGKSLHDACVFANALSALEVQRIGAANAMPTRAEIDDFLLHC